MARLTEATLSLPADSVFVMSTGIIGQPLPMEKVEAGIRAFDPCLSCSTHAIGQMPMVVTMIDHRGEVITEQHRG